MRIKKGFVLRTLGNEQIVSGEGLEQINFTKLVSLNPSAAYLWKEVEGTDFDVQTLTDLLVKRYAVDENTARTDAEKLLKSWNEAGLLEEQ